MTGDNNEANVIGLFMGIEAHRNPVACVTSAELPMTDWSLLQNVEK